MSLSDLIDLALEAADHSDDYSSEGSVYRSPSVRELLRQEDLSLEQQEARPVDLPRYLYHGSAYRQDELKPGFQHTKELVKWDNSEDNTWLYASDDKDAAVMLGISSAIEKKYKLDRYQCDEKAKKMTIDVSEPLTLADIHKLHVVIYSIKADVNDGWMANHNPANGINGEYKTQRTIKDNIVRCEDVRIADVLRGWRIQINVTEPAMESLSTIVSAIKQAMGFKSPEQKRKFAHNQVIENDVKKNRTAVVTYLNQYFGNAAWLAKQEFVDEVPTTGLSPALSVGGKFLSSIGEVATAVENAKALVKKADGYLTNMDHQVQAIHQRSQGPILAAINAEDHKKVEELAQHAIEEFEKIKPEVLNIKDIPYLSGRVTRAVKIDPKHSDLELSEEHIAAHAPGKIKALTSAEIQHAAKIVQELMTWAGEKHYQQAWLSHDGGTDFHEKFHDFHDYWFDEYFGQWDHNTPMNFYTFACPWPAAIAEDVATALLHWMDRSIKGNPAASMERKDPSSVSMEGLSQILASVKKAFGIKSAEEKRQAAHGVAVGGKIYMEKESHVIEEYLHAYFGNAGWLAKQEFNAEVSSAGLAQPLSVNGKFLSDLGQVEKAVNETIALAKKADGMMAQMSQHVKAVRAKYVPKLQAAIKADDHAAVEALGRQAVAEFRAIERPVLSLAGSSFIPGETIFKEEPPKHHGDYPRGHQYWLGRKVVPAKAPEKIKALTSAEIQHAVKIIETLLKVSKENFYWHGWLDFSGGDDFSEELQDFDESVYMDFYDVWDYQSVDQVFTGALPHADVYGQAVVVALLHWMDRSIRGETK